MRTTPLLFLGCVACSQTPAVVPNVAPLPPGNTISSRFEPPVGFDRTAAAIGSFGHYLRNLPLKPAGSEVHLFNGELKPDQSVHAAVLDVSVGDKDLQQCADAVMRLRAEYLFANERQDEITFPFTNGFHAEWKRWRKGERIRVSGNTCSWQRTAIADTSHAQLLLFLEKVFTYAGTRSLQRDLDASTAQDLRIGDVFIQGGSPGHAVIVVDKASDEKGRIAFLLAQSYMPAQEIHVLKNLQEPELGAWFLLNDHVRLVTPQWTFAWADRRCWKNE